MIRAVNVPLDDSVDINGSSRDGKATMLPYPVVPLPFDHSLFLLVTRADVLRLFPDM
jgi:hypothetical protein